VLSWHVKALPGLVPMLGVLLCAGGLLSLGSLRSSATPAVALLVLWAGLACWTAFRQRGQALSGWVLVLALVLRLLLLSSPASFSDDVWRYLWEGRVQLAGMDPFMFAPDAAELVPLQNETWTLVNHKSVSTIYPPGALFLFRLVAAIWENPLSWKLLSGAADLGTVAMLWRCTKTRGTPLWAVVLYALHPLPILESAGSAHLEGLALFFCAWALSAKPGFDSFAAGLGASIKLVPAALWIPQVRASPARAALGAGLAVLLGLALSTPFLSAGSMLTRGFDTYYEAWAFNAWLFPLVEAVIGEPTRLLLTAGGALWCAIAAWRFRDPALFLLAVAVALVFLSPVVHPWYFLWVFLPAMVLGRWEWAPLATTGLLSYLVLAGYPETPWLEPKWVVWIEYPPAVLVWAWAWTRRRSASRSEGGPTL
jgi:alpha-1,6-mannosyltransferase